MVENVVIKQKQYIGQLEKERKRLKSKQTELVDKILRKVQLKGDTQGLKEELLREQQSTRPEDEEVKLENSIDLELSYLESKSMKSSMTNKRRNLKDRIHKLEVEL